MVTEIKNKLGCGVYSVAEAALYARVSARMMNRWLFGGEQGKSVIAPQYGANERVVSFLDFVQTLAIREIRMQKKIALAKFRQAIALAKNRFDLDYPFARQHCTYLFGEELVIAPPGEGYIEASGQHRGQRLFEFVEIYLENLSFNERGLASAYRVYSCKNQVNITMKPSLRFGEPLLPSGYSALAIWESIRVEGSWDKTANAFGISVAEVAAAYRFFVDHLGKTAA